MEKSIVWIGDLHVGSVSGLTTEPENDIQQQILDRYEKAALGLKEIDLLVVNGDSVDGPDTRGFTSSIPDLNEQDKQAAELISMWPAKEIVLTTGTPYHTGDMVQHEENIKNLLEARGSKCQYLYSLDIVVNGWFRVFARHHIGSSSVPHGRGTAPTRAKVWKQLNASIKGAAAPNLCVFSHTHYYNFTEDAFGSTVILPCWQGPGGRYGESKCDGHIDIGYFKTTIGDKATRSWSWEKTLYPIVDHQRLKKL